MNRTFANLRRLLTAALIAAAVSLTSLFCLTAFAMDVKISFSDPSAAVGDTVNVAMHVVSSTGEPLGSASIMLKYDPEALEFVNGDNTEGGAGSLSVKGQATTDAKDWMYGLNFKALKDQLPEIDAVNNDDEHCYDVTTAVRFHAMMKQLGYRTTVAPYTNKDYWQSLVSQLNSACPGACDCVMVQCYDGGAGNQPRDWHLEGLPLHAGRTNYQTDMQTSIAQMQTWRDEDNVTGAFVWVYNDETWNLNQWASAMNRVFPTKTTQEPVRHQR